LMSGRWTSQRSSKFSGTGAKKARLTSAVLSAGTGATGPEPRGAPPAGDAAAGRRQARRARPPGDVDAARRPARTARPAEQARPAVAGFGVSYSLWIPGRAAAGQLGFPLLTAVRPGRVCPCLTWAA